MKSFRKARRWAALGGALAALFLAQASSAMASVATPSITTPQGMQPPPEGDTTYVCANGGQGLCLITFDNEVVQNDTFGSGPQQWSFTVGGGVTHGKGAGPFSNSNLDQMVTIGRTWGYWTMDTGGLDPLCLDYQAGQIELTGCNTSGTEWVLSGSGRMINVLHSDQEGDLQFLNSSMVNGGTPSLHTGNDCPAACWGPQAG